ncbi:MAG: ATP-binding cassette domain-containing protein [Planctomycetes bacterium]|nr:ATP-binding cassette domain-containing protein [Planctomycetota bacterium]
MIEVKNLTKKYPGVTAVNNISFEVNRGEIVGFLGPNAAGKSTTMKMLTCYLPPTAGTASVGGFDIMENPLEIRRKIGYLAENNPLYNDLRVSDFLSFVADMRHIPSTDKREKVKRIIKTCGLEKVIKQNIGKLSKGFRQRVGLAQAMIHDPEVLILDEPTSGLDPIQIVEIRDLIKELGKEKTVIFSTHILAEVEATCTRVIIINEGKIAGSGTIEELQCKARSGAVVYAKIRGSESDIINKLKTLDKITGIKTIQKSSDNLSKYEITCAEDIDINEKIFHLAKDNNWTLAELYKEEATLEDVFIKLTKQDNK